MLIALALVTVLQQAWPDAATAQDSPAERARTADLAMTDAEADAYAAADTASAVDDYDDWAATDAAAAAGEAAAAAAGLPYGVEAPSGTVDAAMAQRMLADAHAEIAAVGVEYWALRIQAAEACTQAGGALQSLRAYTGRPSLELAATARHLVAVQRTACDMAETTPPAISRTVP